MTAALPAKVIITGLDQPYVWTKPGDLLPKDYYIERRADGGLRFGLGALGDLALQVATQKVDLTRAYHLGPHHVRVEDASGAPIIDKDAIGHWWNARWPLRVNPLQAVRPWSQNFAERLAFPMGKTSIPLGLPGAVPMAKWVFTDPMDTAGMSIGMPITGERPEIGVMSDMSALSVLGISDGPMLACGDASLSCPQYFRDESTGRPIDLFKWPEAEAYDLPGYMGWPYLPKGPKDPRPGFNYQVWGGGWVVQGAHYYEMAYFAYLRTLDEEFLHAVQYGANFVVLTDGAISLRQHKAIPHGEYRGIAWAFRSLFMAHAATVLAEKLGILPTTCHPSSYFKALLDNALAYYGTAVTDPKRQAFHNVSLDLVIVGGRPVIPPWQENYMLLALGEGVLTGHDDWIPLYLWALQSEIVLTDGSAGVPPGYGSIYYADATQPDWKSAWLFGVVQDWNPDGTIKDYLGGAEAPTAAELAKVAADPFNGYVPVKGGMEPLMVRRAVFVQAQYLSDNWAAFGLPGQSPRDMYPTLDTCVVTVDRLLKSDPSNKMDPRDAFVRSLSPTTTPPVGGTHMGKPVSVNVGQHVSIPFTYDDGTGKTCQVPTGGSAVSVPSGLVNATVTINPNGTGSIDVVGLAASAVGAVLKLDLQGGANPVTDQVALTVAVPLPLVGAVHLNP